MLRQNLYNIYMNLNKQSSDLPLYDFVVQSHLSSSLRTKCNAVFNAEKTFCANVFHLAQMETASLDGLNHARE